MNDALIYNILTAGKTGYKLVEESALTRQRDGKCMGAPGVQGEKSMTYSPVSCSRPTLLLTTVSWVSRWCVLHRYVICASLRVILIIINSPVGSIWYLPSITTRAGWREGEGRREKGGGEEWRFELRFYHHGNLNWSEGNYVFIRART